MHLWATLGSHGLGRLAPAVAFGSGAAAHSLETTLDLGGGETRFVRPPVPRSATLEIDIAGPRASARPGTETVRQVRAIFALELDLSDRYAQAARDP